MKGKNEMGLEGKVEGDVEVKEGDGGRRPGSLYAPWGLEHPKS